MFFKKQAFKLKDLLQEKGVDLPLVTIQEILAKSYGFNNRHVALATKEFHETLEAITYKKEKLKNDRTNTPLNQMPYLLKEQNLSQFQFWWDYNETPIHYPNTIVGSPFSEEYQDMEDLVVYKETPGQNVQPTCCEYKFNKLRKEFEKKNVIKVFLHSKKLPTFFNLFEQVDLTPDDVSLMLESAISWKDEIKKILLHKDCPISVLREYAKDEDFFVRITAIFSKHHRDELAILAKHDPDVRVRRSYYKHLLVSGTPISEVRALIVEDPSVVTMMRNIAIGGEYVVNW